MLRLIAIISLFLILIPAFGARHLSGDARISLLTCDSGQELYSLYGHSAIRVKDDSNAIDHVFNYGTFDFNTPNFYLKFANGNLKYMLSTTTFNRFLNEYFTDERSVWEQELNLDQTEKQALFDAIVENSLPENKFYRYDFFFDNCATRIRDIVYRNIDGDISYVDTTLKTQSFRQFIHEYETKTPWVKDGLDLLLGWGTDDIADANNQMFLPDYLMLYFCKAIITKEGEETRNLVKEMRPLLRFEIEEENSDIITPTLLFWILLLIGSILTFYEIKIRKKPLTFVNRILFLLVSLVGLLIVFLWFFTRHGVTASNFNIMWSNPLFLLLALLPVRQLKSNTLKIVIYLILISMTLFLLGWFIIPQHIPSMVFPLVLLLIIRTGYFYSYINK
nr:DUF4105 domain-containing protein [uncultured Carboxylicivirga sp.]